MPTALCAYCGRGFARSLARSKYCQQACYVADLRQRGAEGLIARFWAKVQTNGPVLRADLGACWIWTASTIRGYGQFHLPRSSDQRHIVFAHRFAWELEHGPIPDNLSVLHQCDNPLCVRTDHLFLGTQPDNLADARTKGRLIDGQHLIKVSDADVAYIRAHYRPRENSHELAARFGITRQHVARLARVGRTRKPPVFERVPHVVLPVLGDVR